MTTTNLPFTSSIILVGPSLRYIPQFVLESKIFWLAVAVLVILSILFKDKFQRWADKPTADLFKSRSGSKPEAQKTDGPTITYTSNGRSGQVHYRSTEGNFDLYFEYGGASGVVAWLYVPGPADWTAKTGLPPERRDEVLHFIGRQVAKDQISHGSGSFKIEGNYLTIYG